MGLVRLLDALPLANRALAPLFLQGHDLRPSWHRPAAAVRQRRRLGRGRKRLCVRAAAQLAQVNATREISKDQIDDVSGVVSRAMMIPGVPDWIKLGVVKRGVSGVADAVNGGALPTELRDNILAALGDGLVSERLADQVVVALAPHVDIPFVSPEQERELLKQIVAAFLVQRDSGNPFVDAVHGTATIATTQGKGIIRAMSELRSDESRALLAKRLSNDIEFTDFLGPENEEKFMRIAVDTLGKALLSQVPSEALEAAVLAGDEDVVEEFLCTVLAKEMNVPFVSEDQKRTMAQTVVRGWLGSVDKEALAREQQDAEERGRLEAAERARAMQDLQSRGAEGLQVAGAMGAAAGNLLRDAAGAVGAAAAAEGASRQPRSGNALETSKEKLDIPKQTEAGGGAGRGAGGGGGRQGGGGRDGNDGHSTGAAGSKNESSDSWWLIHRYRLAAALFSLFATGLMLSFAWARRTMRPTTVSISETKLQRWRTRFRTSQEDLRHRLLERMRVASSFGYGAVRQLSSPVGSSGWALAAACGVVVVCLILRWFVPALANAFRSQTRQEATESFGGAVAETELVPSADKASSANLLVVVVVVVAIVALVSDCVGKKSQGGVPASMSSRQAARPELSMSAPSFGSQANPKLPPKLPIVQSAPSLQVVPVSGRGLSSMCGSQRTSICSDVDDCVLGIAAQIRGELRLWLWRTGEKSFDVTTAAQATAVFMLESARLGLADFATIICPYERMHFVLADLEAHRYMGARLMVHNQQDWPKIRELISTPGEPNAGGLVVRPNGAVHAVVPRGIQGVGEWGPFTQRHGGVTDARPGGGIVIVVGEMLPEAAVGVTVYVSGSHCPWQSPSVQTIAPAPSSQPGSSTAARPGRRRAMRLRLPAPPSGLQSEAYRSEVEAVRE